MGADKYIDEAGLGYICRRMLWKRQTENEMVEDVAGGLFGTDVDRMEACHMNWRKQRWPQNRRRPFKRMTCGGTGRCVYPTDWQTKGGPLEHVTYTTKFIGTDCKVPPISKSI